VLGAITAVMVFLLAGRFFGGRGRAWAGWIAALYPPWVYYTGLMLTETLFILLLLVCWYLAARIAEKPIASDVLMCGLLGAAAVLTKGSGLGLVVIMAPVVVIIARHRWKAALAMAGVLVVLGIGLSPWVARNYRITQEQNQATGKSENGDIVVTTCSVGRSLYEAVGPEADGGPAMDKIAVPVKMGVMTEHDVDREYHKMAMEAIEKNPGRFVKLAMVKFLRTWSVVPNFQEYRKPLYMLVMALSVAPIVILALWGWWVERARVRDWVLVLLPVAYFTAMHMVFVGSVRYREPAMAFLMILAGAAIASLLGRGSMAECEHKCEHSANTDAK
jgi:4-amino-4-deoxy-L-arabinose transferase-like glycosyltransferase